VTSGVPIEGNRPGLVPASSGNLWVTVQATRRLIVGGGVTSAGDRFTSNDNGVTLPGYARVDSAVSYRAGLVDVSLNIRNILDRTYYETAASNFQIYPGTPREFVVSVRVRP
jgi:catecholate siderophore receptor